LAAELEAMLGDRKLEARTHELDVALARIGASCNACHSEHRD
jgi:cytochrome c556